MKQFFAGCLLILLSISPVFAGETAKISPLELTSEQFMSIVRNPPGRESWALMRGTAAHKRKGARAVEAPIRLGILFTPARTVAQIVFNGDEYYNLSQTFANPPVSAQDVQLKDEKNPQLSVYGVAPGDLAMGFLYQPVLAEEPSEKIKGFICRVFRLKSLDDEGAARVFISAEYFFPVKVEWFSKADPNDLSQEQKPYRTLEVGAFKKEKDFWLVTEINLYGSDWRTKIEFEERSAGFIEDGLPRELFIERK